MAPDSQASCELSQIVATGFLPRKNNSWWPSAYLSWRNMCNALKWFLSMPSYAYSRAHPEIRRLAEFDLHDHSPQLTQGAQCTPFNEEKFGGSFCTANEMQFRWEHVRRNIWGIIATRPQIAVEWVAQQLDSLKASLARHRLQ